MSQRHGAARYGGRRGVLSRADSCELGRQRKNSERGRPSGATGSVPRGQNPHQSRWGAVRWAAQETKFPPVGCNLHPGTPVFTAPRPSSQQHKQIQAPSSNSREMDNRKTIQWWTMRQLGEVLGFYKGLMRGAALGSSHTQRRQAALWRTAACICDLSKVI